MPQETPCFFIVGAPRCGTTALSRYLRSHPNICFSKPKETHFFLSPPSNLSASQTGSYFIENYFPQRNSQQWMLGEGSVSYLFMPDALRRIIEVFPLAKFIVMVRNPVDMIPSYHGRMIFLRQETESDFGRAWALQASRARGTKVPGTCRDSRLLQYGQIGRLGMHVAHLFEEVGRERCHVTVFDDLAEQPLETYRRILDFIGVPYDGRNEFPRKNGQRTFKSATLQSLYTGAFLLPLSSFWTDRFANPAQLLRLTRPLRRRLRKLNTSPANREPLPPQMRAMLAEEFREDIDLLGQILGRDLSHWADQCGVKPASGDSEYPARARRYRQVIDGA